MFQIRQIINKRSCILYTAKRQSSVLVIAEHDNEKLSSTTARVITAAKKLGDKLTVLVAGTKCEPAVQALSKTAGVERILTAEHGSLNGFLAENVTSLIVNVQKQINATHLLTGASSFGKNVMPRIASKLDVSPISDITNIKDGNTFVRAVYAGNAIQTVKSLDKVKVITIRGTSFTADPLTGGSPKAEKISADGHVNSNINFVSQSLNKSDRPDLATARIVVSGGRGLGSKENFKLVYDLATKMGAGIGATRAAVDAGFVPNDFQIGQTGKIIAPDLYIAIGISGAIQHIAGIKDAKAIVAINKDAEAPIFQISNYGLVADLFQAVPEMINKIK